MYGRRGYPLRDPVSSHPKKNWRKNLPPTDAGDKNSTNPYFQLLKSAKPFRHNDENTHTPTKTQAASENCLFSTWRSTSLARNSISPHSQRQHLQYANEKRWASRLIQSTARPDGTRRTLATFTSVTQNNLFFPAIHLSPPFVFV